jgi:tetratricopeptide (TPR) repeat protein
VTSAATRAALVALSAARPAIARLDRSRDPEDLAADIIEGWSGVESALRTLLGGSQASGTDLFHEASQAGLVTLAQANALAAFHAARDRAHDTSYRPTDADLGAAREAFLKLETALLATGELPQAPPARELTPPGMRTTPLGVAEPVPPPGAKKRHGLRWTLIVLAIVAIAGVAAWWFTTGRRDAAMRHALALFEQGDRIGATSEFTRAATYDPSYALPHVYLARIARDANNMPQALQQLQLALADDPGNALALREMGAYLFTQANYELARRFYVRAVQADPSDHAAQGYLGCTLVRLGRADEGARWLERAGNGPWSACTPAPGGAPPTAPAPASVPR